MRCSNNTRPGYRQCGLMWHGGPRPTRGWYGRGRIVTGKQSRFPLAQLSAKYHEMQKDGRLLSNRKSIEILNYRIQQLAERIDQSEAPDRLKRLGRLWKKFSYERLHGDSLEVMKYQKQLDAEFEAAAQDYAAWKQMFDAVDLHRSLVESEVKIAKDMKSIMTAEDGYQMIAKIFAIILELEDDPKKLKRYQYEFTQLVGDGEVLEAQWQAEEESEDG